MRGEFTLAKLSTGCLDESSQALAEPSMHGDFTLRLAELSTG